VTLFCAVQQERFWGVLLAISCATDRVCHFVDYNLQIGGLLNNISVEGDKR